MSLSSLHEEWTNLSSLFLFHSQVACYSRHFKKASGANHSCFSTSKLIIFKQFTMLKSNFNYFCWSYSLHYKHMPRTGQEDEGSQLFSSICNSRFYWNISTCTILRLKNIQKASALTILHVLMKKKKHTHTQFYCSLQFSEVMDSFTEGYNIRNISFSKS